MGRYLEGGRFPIRKQELVAQLERNGVPGPVLGQLRERLPEASTGGRRRCWAPCARGASRGR